MKRKIFFQRLENILQETGSKKLAVAFSGGKDSTVLLHLTLEFCMRNSIPLIIMHGDTLVENPIVKEYCENFLTELERWARNQNFNLQILISKPASNDTFWVNVIGKGYPLPNFRFRWCQSRLKIKPSERILKSLAETENSTMLVGMRMSESIGRKKSLEKRMNGMELERHGARVFAPIYDWTDDDIWEFLVNNTPPWGNSHEQLIEMYRKARGECPLIPDKNMKTLSGCGSRFGCWVCSVVKEDKTAVNLAKKHQEVDELLSFRNWLIEFTSIKENRLGFSRKGKWIREGAGMITRSARQTILIRLLELQDRLNMTLIHDCELSIIEKLWKQEQEKFCMMDKQKEFDELLFPSQLAPQNSSL